MRINPKKINRNDTEKILKKLYQQEGKTFFIYRLTESGQHVITRSYVENAKMVIDHVPVFFNQNEVYLDYRVGEESICHTMDGFPICM